MITASRFLSSLLILSLLASSCSTGKRSLEKGNYDRAVIKAVSRLQKDGNNSTAMRTLKQAYRYASEDHLQNIREAAQSANLLRWETIIAEYEALNRLTDEIRSCPPCREQIPEGEKYMEQLAEARLKAADVRYARGLKFLQEGNRLSSKQAFFDFERAGQLYPDYKDSRQKTEEAFQAALLKVVVEPVSLGRSVYELSNDYFQDKIFEYLRNYESRSFVKFFTPKEAGIDKLVPDHVLRLNFDDFVVGQTYVKERVEEVKRDSVKIGKADGKDVYGTVKAQLSVFEKTISSAGLLNVEVIEWRTKKVLSHEKMEGAFVWQDQWGSYKGDERALTDEQKKLMRKREVYPPAPQYLFTEFTRPLYAQLTDKLRRFYSRY